jgi:hypothetical protein
LTFPLSWPSIVNHGDERRLLVSGHVYILAHKMSSVNQGTVSAFSSYPCYNGEWTNVGGLAGMGVVSERIANLIARLEPEQDMNSALER